MNEKGYSLCHGVVVEKERGDVAEGDYGEWEDEEQDPHSLVV